MSKSSKVINAPEKILKQCVCKLTATGESEHAAHARRCDLLIRGYLDKATAFSGADWCVGIAKMPLKDGQGRNCSSARGCKTEFECSRSYPLNRKYLDNWQATAFSSMILPCRHMLHFHNTALRIVVRCNDQSMSNSCVGHLVLTFPCSQFVYHLRMSP